ncbi:MAG TPA: metalloregulator ArsR/SmtB family transcription factor [Lapillicoccus sp.]
MDGFDALADPIRRDLLRQLSAGPARVVDLTAAYDVTRPAVSRHLRLLIEAGVASAEDHGRERHYRLEPAGLGSVRRFLEELDTRRSSSTAVPTIDEAALDALDTEVRRTRRERHRTTDDPDRRTHRSREDAG